MRPKVFYTHWVPEDGESLLRPCCRIVRHRLKRPPTSEEIVAGAHNAWALCCSVRDHVGASVLEACPGLAIVSSFGRGHDNIDVETATRLGVWVSTIEFALTEPVADMAWALLLALARKLLPGDRIVRSRGFRGWDPRPPAFGCRVAGGTLGVIGMGQVGQAVARRARGFSMRTLYWQPDRLTQAEEAALGVTWVSKPQLLAASDFVALCTPLTSDTYHQIGARELQAIKEGALLVNISRGSEVDEKAVAAALEGGRLGGYAADVFELEDIPPVDGERPIRIPEALLRQTAKTVFSPHASTAILETRTEIAKAQARPILDLLAGRRPTGAVNEPAEPRAPVRCSPYDRAYRSRVTAR